MSFEESKRTVFSIISDLKGKISTKNLEILEDVEKKLKENRFNLVVLGQFKRGKTTFINALLGEKVLPSAVLPLTSIVTLIEYGPTEKAEVIFLSGERKEIATNEIKLYVTEKENPKNEKGVSLVRLFHPSPLLKKGIILVDTPGVGSLYENNTDVTYGFLPRVDAAIFLLTVDPPLSKEEISFLKDIEPHVEKLFFLLNKIDYVDEDELEEVLRFSKENLKKALGLDDVTIFPISAKTALEGRIRSDESMIRKSGIEKFERVLERFLFEERGKVILRSSINKVLNVISERLFSLEIEIKTAEDPVDELERKIEKFKEIKDEIVQEKRDSEFLFRGEVDSLIKLVNSDMERFQNQRIPKIYSKILEILEENKGKPSMELSKTMDEAFKRILVKELDDMLNEEEKRVNEEYGRIARRFSGRINNIVGKLMDLSAELFDIPLERFETEEEITEESSLWYRLEDSPRLIDFEGVAKFISYAILPSSVVHKKIKNEFKKKIPEKVDMNCGRIRSDLVDRIKKSSMELRWGMEQKLNQTISFVEDALKRAMELKEKGKGELEETIRRLNERKSRLEMAMKSLKRIAGYTEGPLTFQNDSGILRKTAT